MADAKKIDVTKLTEPEMVQLLIEKSKAIEKKNPELAERAASYRAHLTSNTPEALADNAQTFKSLKTMTESWQANFLGVGKTGIERYSSTSLSASLDVPSYLSSPLMKKMMEADVLARQPYDPAKLAQMSDKEMAGRLHEQSLRINEKFPELTKQANAFGNSLFADTAEAKAGRTKLFEEIRKNPELAQKYIAPDSQKGMATSTDADSFFRYSTAKMGGTYNGPSQNTGFLGGLFGGNGGGGGLGGLSGLGEIFKKLSEMFTKLLSSLGFGGAKGGATQGTTPTAKPNTPAAAAATAAPTPAPKPGPAQPAPQQTAQSKDPSKDQPKDQPKDDGQKTAAAAQEATPEDAASPAGEELAGADATKPLADEVGKDLGQGKVNPETAAKAAALKDKVGATDPAKPLVLPDATKDDQTGAQKTSAADVPQEWAALQDKFGITPDHLSKLKAPETTVAAANEETIGPRAAQQSSGFKLS